MEKKVKQENAIRNDDSLVFEIDHSNENIVKAISFHEGKKQEVYMYVLAEEEFEALIPQTKQDNGPSRVVVID